MADYAGFKFCCQDCHFTTHKEKKLLRHVRKSHDKNVLKCPFCNIKGNYHTSIKEFSAHKKREHKGLRLRCFLCEFASKSLTKWAKHCRGHQEMDCLTAFASYTNSSIFEPEKTVTAHDSNGLSSKDQFNGTHKKPVSGQMYHTDLISPKSVPNPECHELISISSDEEASIVEICSGENEETNCVNITSSVEDLTLVGFDKALAPDHCNTQDNQGENNSGPFCGNNLRPEVENYELSPLLSQTNGENVVKETELQCKNRATRKVAQRQFTCEICDKILSSQRSLKRHLLIHSGVKPHKCSLCDKSFTHKLALHCHIINMHDKTIRRFVCEYCPKVYTSKGHKMAHIRAKHEMTSKFVCSFDRCSFSTTDANSLERHIRIHTGEKPFSCSYCQYKTSQSQHLKRHLMRHTKEKPFKCTLCDYATCDKSNLKTHLRRHTGEKPYRCENCQRCFSHSQGLRHHLDYAVCAR